MEKGKSKPDKKAMALQELMYVILALIAIFFAILIFVKTGRIFK